MTFPPIAIREPQPRLQKPSLVHPIVSPSAKTIRHIPQQPGLTQQHLERLQHLEHLQRLGSRVRLAQAATAANRPRLLSHEVVRAATQQQQQHQQGAPSKYVIMPRASVAPITLPFCGVQALKGGSKGESDSLCLVLFARKLDRFSMSYVDREREHLLFSLIGNFLLFSLLFLF